MNIPVLTGSDPLVSHNNPCTPGDFPQPPTVVASFVEFIASLEMITRAQQSTSASDRSFNSTLMYFDPDDYDDVDFYIGAQAENNNITTPYNIYIEDADTAEELFSISIPANTGANVWTFANAGAPVTWPSGKRKLRMKLERSASDNQLKVNKLRIFYDQGESATKTRHQFSFLLGGGINNNDLAIGDSRFTFGDSGYFAESLSSIIQKTLGKWDGVVNWTLESVAGNTGGLGVNHCYVALYNQDTVTKIVENDHQQENSFTDLLEVDFLDNDANFGDNVEVELYTRATTTQANNSLLLAARLYVRQLNYTKTMFARQLNNQQLEGGDFRYTGSIEITYDVTAIRSSVGDAYVALGYSDTSGGITTEVVGTNLSFPAVGTKSRDRSGPIDLIAGDKWYLNKEIVPTGGAVTVKQGYVLIALEK